MGDCQEARRDSAVAFRQVGVVAVLAQGGSALHRVGFAGHAEQRNLGAYQCTVGFIEVQKLQALVVAGQLQILAYEAPCQAFQATIFQVHRQKSGVGVHVGKAERLVELDAVEDHHAAIDQRGVAQVNVAVAFAGIAIELALRKQRLEAFEAAFSPGLQSLQLSQVGLVAEEWADLVEVLAYRSHHLFRRAGGVILRDFGGAEVELRNLLGHLIDVRAGQFAVGLQGAEHLALRELAHFQRVLDGRAVATQLRRLGSAGNRQHFKIQIFGQALVEAQFLAAEMPAVVQIGDVQEAEVHRFLQLICIGARQYHPGNMGLDDLKRVNRMRVQGRVLQGSDQGLAHGRSFKVWGKSWGALWLLMPVVQTAVRLMLIINKVRIIRRHDSNPISPFP